MFIAAFYKCIYLLEREREHKQGGGAVGEADSPLSREPDPGIMT